jgi:hypothetical protein
VKLEQVSAAVRPRSQWEAIDLGLRMARTHYRSMFLSSLALTLPLFMLLQLGFRERPWIAALCLWWLKPLWERVHLHILSRSLFGDTPSVRQTLADFPSYGFRQWLPWLTIRRLTPTRSLDLPVTQLEELSGARRRKRLDILRQGPSSSGAFWLLVIGAHIEGFIYLSAVLLAQLLVPQTADVNLFEWFFGFGVASDGPAFLQNLLSLVGALLVAPFYVAGGFGLYINRRTVLEGWDLEISFRRLAERLSARPDVRPAASVLAVLLAAVIAGMGVTSPLPATADPAPADTAASRESPADRGSAQESILAILAGEEFHEIETRHVPRFALDSETAEGDPSWLMQLIERFFLWLDGSQDEPSERSGWLADLLTWLPAVIAQASEALLIAGAALIVLYILFRYRETLLQAASELSPALARRASAPSVLMGMEVSQDSLPQDIIAAVLESWRRGEPRAACSLLYRATLSELMNAHAIEFHAGSTERDCLRAAAPMLSERHADFFGDLTRQWQLLAYAHRPPSDATMQSLCTSWTQLFRMPSRSRGADDVA